MEGRKSAEKIHTMPCVHSALGMRWRCMGKEVWREKGRWRRRKRGGKGIGYIRKASKPPHYWF